MIELSAPAKVNLFLHVLGRREDGYHELVSRMQKVDLCDTLRISRRTSPGVAFFCSDKRLPTGNSNLAVLAATTYLHAAGFGSRCGLEIRLEKRIPVAAGLGGGSSDAGAVLRGLNTLFNNALPAEQLVALGGTLGADVPFFTVDYTAAVARGIGERLSAAADIEGFWILLVNPGISVSTRTVFENYALTTLSKNSTLPSFDESGLDRFCCAQMHNDLEAVTMASHPVIGTIKHSLIEDGATAAMMSGSGPTVFGLFSTERFTARQIDTLVDKFALAYGQHVYATRTYTGV